MALTVPTGYVEKIADARPKHVYGTKWRAVTTVRTHCPTHRWRSSERTRRRRRPGTLSSRELRQVICPVLRILDVYPGSELSPSRIRIKEFKYFNPQKTKKWVLSSRKYDPGCSSRIPDPDADFLPIPGPGSRGQKGTGSGSATLDLPPLFVLLPIRFIKNLGHHY